MYDSIDHVLACGFYGMRLQHPKFQQESHILVHASTFKPNGQITTLCLLPSIIKSS